jgi:hypothetical protein
MERGGEKENGGARTTGRSGKRAVLVKLKRADEALLQTRRF